MRRLKSKESRLGKAMEATPANARILKKLDIRRQEIEERIGELSNRQAELSRQGNYSGAEEALRERRYWEFVCHLLSTDVGNSKSSAAVSNI